MRQVIQMKTLIYLSIIAAITVSTHAAADAGACLIDPLDNVLVSSQYGKYRKDLGATVHQGYDLVNAKVTNDWNSKQIYAAAEGEIVYAGFRAGSYGNMIAIKRTNAGAQTGDLILYKHVRNVYKVKKGDTVKPGQHIGYYSGTKNSEVAKKGDQYDPHLHFEYMVTQNRAQQYEYNPSTKTVAGKFMHLDKKGTGEVRLAALHAAKFYTDPAPYVCNNWKMQVPSNNGYGFKTIRDQYNFILAKLGKSGFEVGGVPNNVVSGAAPGTAEYSIAMGCTDLEQTLLTQGSGSESNSGASSPQGASSPATGT